MVIRSSDVTATTVTSFKELYIEDSLCAALSAAGYDRPSPVQEAVLPLCLSGADLIVQATSGTGKTVLISCSCLNQARKAATPDQTVALVVAPTRELAVQIHDVTTAIGRHWCPQIACHAFIGGMPIDEDRRRLRRRRDIVVGTPGRLLALLHASSLALSAVSAFVLDEADRLLTGSMYDATAEIYAQLPRRKQVLAVSATFDSLALAQLLPMMKRPRRFDVRQTDRAAPQAVRHVYTLVQPHGAGAAAAPTPAPQPETAGALLRAAADAAAAKSFPALPKGLGGEGIVEAVPGPWGGPVAAGGDAMRRAVEALVEAKAAKLLQLLRTILFNQAIVFCNDPEVAPALAEHLAALGVPTVHVSARLPQPARLAAMAALRALGARVAVTSDVLSRGIDLEYVNAVVNFDLPADGATYAHRLGRCGRFGAAAVAVTLVASEEELERLRQWAGTCSAGALEPLPDVIPDEWYYRRPDHAAAAAALQPLHIHSAAAPAPSTEASAPPHLLDSPQGTTAGAYAAALDSAESSATAQAPESAACGPPCAQSPLAADSTSHDKLPPGGGASSPRPPALPADAQRSPAAVWDTWVRANEADMAWLAGASPVQAGTGQAAGGATSGGRASAAAAVPAAGVDGGGCGVTKRAAVGGVGGAADLEREEAEAWARGVVAAGAGRGELWLHALEEALVRQRRPDAVSAIS